MPVGEEYLLDYIGAARWFGGKGRDPQLLGVTALGWLSEPGTWPAVRIEIIELGFGDGGRDLYQLPISYYPDPQAELAASKIGHFELPELGPVVGYDAVWDRSASSAILALLLAGKEIAGDQRAMLFHCLANPLTGSEEPRVFAGQQSNTSIMFGDVAMLKLFRKLELGRNLDIEIHRQLKADGEAEVADLYGWIDASWPTATGPVTADLGMLVEQLSGATDGWELALVSDDFTENARQLGQSLAEIHGGLARQFPTGVVAGSLLCKAMQDRLSQAESAAPILGDYAAELRSCFASLGDREWSTQRIHGDFHLGQTLHTPDGWKIIDFEGEPAKSLAERRQADSIWRDVAGMLRSFDYAAAQSGRPSKWAANCREAFLAGYTAQLDASDHAALRAYEADKAVYEVVYEVRNRPDWAHIPLTAVRALIGADQPTARPETEEL